MKLRSLYVYGLLIACATAQAQTADQWITSGLNALAASDVKTADADFNQALAQNPNSAPANVLAAATRLLQLPAQSAGSNFLTQIGVTKTGRDLFNWTAAFSQDANGKTVFPANLNTTTGIAFYTNTVMAAVRASLANLSKVTDPTFTLSLTAQQTHSQAVTLDYGDVLLLRAGLEAIDFFGFTLAAHNWSVVINHLQDLGQANQLTPQKLLADYPSLLAQPNKSQLAASQTSLTNAINLYFQASGFIRTNRAPGVDRLFNLAADMTDKEASFRNALTVVQSSIANPARIATNDNASLYLGAYFSGATSLRSLMPAFNGKVYLNGSLPDYTFGGVLLNEPAWKVEKALRKKLGMPFDGIYTGTTQGGYMGGVSPGAIALFVQTNGQATLVGADPGLGHGLSATFTVKSGGSWYTETNGVGTDGQIYGDGSFYGEMYSPSNWVSLQGQLQPAAGNFQNSAGLYSGTWSVAGQRGNLWGILAADGGFYWAQFGVSGSVDDGGQGAFGPNNTVLMESVQTTTIAAKLTPASLSITGNVTNSDNTGTFSMSRTQQVLTDKAPAITTAPVNQTVIAGGTVTFKVVASGGAPLSYQWYANGMAIPSATGASLVLSKVQPGVATNYSVTIQNLAGATNAAATLTLVSEANPPTLTISSPTAGQRITNSAATITGTASDKEGPVASVKCQVNGGDWVTASGTAAWSLTNSIIAGTNTVLAYAVDSSGNFSVTNKRQFIGVAAGALVVQIQGAGSSFTLSGGRAAITGSYTNASLEQGKNYTLTAKPGAGLLFSNWTDGAGMPVGSSNTFTFKLGAGTNLQLNCVPNPFLVRKGAFNGLFYDADGVFVTNSGFLTAALTDLGKITAQLRLAASQYTFAGQFSLGGEVFGNATLSGKPPLGLRLHLDLLGTNSLSGWVSNGAWTAIVEANRAAAVKAFAGSNYTVVIPGNRTNSANQPGGYGYGAVNVSPAGAVKFTGALGDGTVVTPSASLSSQGQWPFYVSLYSGKGLVLGWLNLTNQSATNVWGSLSWNKLAGSGLQPYTSGFEFDQNLQAFGSFYSSAAKLGWTNSALILRGGNLPHSLTNASPTRPA